MHNPVAPAGAPAGACAMPTCTARTPATSASKRISIFLFIRSPITFITMEDGFSLSRGDAPLTAPNLPGETTTYETAEQIYRDTTPPDSGTDRPKLANYHVVAIRTPCHLIPGASRGHEPWTGRQAVRVRHARIVAASTHRRRTGHQSTSARNPTGIGKRAMT